MMKARWEILALVAALVICVACGAPAEEAPASRLEVAAVAGSLKTGFGADVSVADSEDGVARSTAVAVGLALDEDGRIAALQADVMQAEITMDGTGKLGVDGNRQYASAKAAGDAAWVGAIAAFEAQAIGATIDDIRVMDVDARLISATERAAQTALYLGAKEGDQLGLGVENVLIYDQGSHARDASDGRDGQAQAYHSYAVVTVDAQGVFTSVILDSTQANVAFDDQGRLTGDVFQPVLTKVELRDQYGMRALSGIGREWFEQAWAIADYASGKTLADFQAISVDEGGRIDDADLVSAATIQIRELTVAMERAAANAK